MEHESIGPVVAVLSAIRNSDRHATDLVLSHVNYIQLATKDKNKSSISIP
jgi:hypothetical protein